MGHLAVCLVAMLPFLSVSKAQYVAEAYIVIDNFVVKKYLRELPENMDPSMRRPQAIQNLKVDLNYILSETNKLLASLRPTIHIELRQRALTILNTEIFPSSSFVEPRKLDVKKALYNAASWFQSQKAYERFNYDLAIFYTGHPFGNGFTGSAFTGTVCDNSTAVALVQAQATYAQAMDTIVHIGHLLGAPNDGRTSKFIMSAFTYTENANRWNFSPCSAHWIRENLEQLKHPNCLTRTNPASIVPSVEYNTYSGKLLIPDAVCERTRQDSRSFMCKSGGLYKGGVPKGDAICRRIYCKIPGTTYCTAVFPSEGTICDLGKRCDNGQCVPDDSLQSQNVDPNCLFGDEKAVNFPHLPFYGTCTQFILEYGASYCYGTARNSCCQTCTRYSTGRPGCEFGDRRTLCRNYTQSAICPQYAQDCCEYCRNYGEQADEPMYPEANKIESGNILERQEGN